MPEIRISLSDDEYELLKQAKGSRSWKQFLLDAAKAESEKEYLTREVVKRFEELKRLLVGTTYDGDFAYLLERLKALLIKTIKIDESKRKKVISEISEKLDVVIKGQIK